jgi:predicted metal-dependent HD superfamily phosphohydrolase
MINRNDKPKFFHGGRTAANLENDLRTILGSFSGGERKIGEIAASVILKYSEEHRFYHDLNHVDALLSIAERFKEKLLDDEAVRLAVWFHDVIYRPQSSNNEFERAELAATVLTESGFPPAKIERVEKMILATARHDAAGLDKDGEFFLDFDLSILGAKEEIYRAYARAIRREYAFVPEAAYRDERRRILQSFLRRGHIYYTAEVRQLCETRARLNIENEIKELS